MNEVLDMYVELIHKKKEKGSIDTLQFRVMAECQFDSPLHVLPELTCLLAKKSLNSYAIHFVLNHYGRFDLEISSQYPAIKNGLQAMNLRKKVGRLHRLFYEVPLAATEQMDYHEFLERLSKYKPQSMSLEDAALFGYPVHWYGLLETYQFLHTTDIDNEDFYQYFLRKTDEKWVSPPMNQTACPFDRDDFFKTQVISGFRYFFLCVNYRPLGDSPFHVMIVPYRHQADFMQMSPDNLFELETLLRATLRLWAVEKEDDICIYLQKHAQSGMTVPHMHIHVLCPSKKIPFREDVIRQLRYFVSCMTKDEEKAHELARKPLSKQTMKRQVWRFQLPIKRYFEREFKVQQRHYAQLRLSRISRRF